MSDQDNTRDSVTPARSTLALVLRRINTLYPDIVNLEYGNTDDPAVGDGRQLVAVFADGRRLRVIFTVAQFTAWGRERVMTSSVIGERIDHELADLLADELLTAIKAT